MNIQEAMKVVTTEIANDPSYRETWKANIAMAFKDEVNRTTDLWCPKWLHDVSNKAADNFLDILCMDANKESAKELAEKWDKERSEAPYALD